MLRGIALQAAENKQVQVLRGVNAMPMKFGKKGPAEGTEHDYGPPTFLESRQGRWGLDAHPVPSFQL